MYTGEKTNSKLEEKTPLMKQELQNIKELLGHIEIQTDAVKTRVGYVDGKSAQEQKEDKAPSPSCLYDEMCVLTERVRRIGVSIGEINERLCNQLG